MGSIGGHKGRMQTKTMFSGHWDTKMAKWQRNNAEATVELGVKGNKMNLSVRNLLTGSQLNLLCLDEKLL